MTTASDIHVPLATRDQLGEGPFWSARQARLWRVDIARALVHAFDPAGGDQQTFQIDGDEVAAVALRAGGGFVLAVDRELRLVDGDRPDGPWRTIAEVDHDRPGNRFNDCRVDPHGRLWAGTMSRARATGEAALHRLGADHRLTRRIPGTTISNGLGWSPARDRMYFVDSTTQRIDVLDYDPLSGTAANRRPFAVVDPADGLPDGLTVDVEGGVWLCLFGGGELRRYDASGSLDERIALPVTNPTCPAFGGPGLRTLYVTSARHKLSEQQLASEPLAGALLALQPGVAGVAASCYAG